MRIYLDDDLASGVLAKLLRQAGHDVQLPANANRAGEVDAVHFADAIGDDRVLLSGNHDDYENLHHVVTASGGHHPGILIVRRDNDPRRDLTRKGIVLAVGNLQSAKIDMTDCFYVLNHWR